MNFSDLGLNPELLKAVTDAGYTSPTPIQAQAIPVVLEGRDVMGGAQTGTGKTASFTLPLLHRLARHANTSASPARHPVRALVLAPTRELALQVYESVTTYGKYLPLRATCIYGGVDMRAQTETLRRGVEIVVATPGRLLDHVEQKTIQLGQVEMLVLDEADRMLDMGFIPDIRRILNLLPAHRQSLLFSATFSDEIKKLADTMLKTPQLIEVARRNAVNDTITHRMHPVSGDHKSSLVTWLLMREADKQALVFVNTKFGCSRLARHLERSGIQADAIHGDKNQQQRSEALDAFRSGKIRVLVATDVAARGIDIDELPFVINYELPTNAEDYVHRIGRTGRAGKQGVAVSLVAPDEKERQTEIENLIKRKIPLEEPEGYTPDWERRQSRRSSERSSESSWQQGRERDHQPRQNFRTSRSSMVAADGFDFSKPYQPRGGVPAKASSATSAGNPNLPPFEQPKQPVAVLLGGTGRVTSD